MRLEIDVIYIINDMKKVDVWVYGMIVFNFINFDLSYFFQRDFELLVVVIISMEKLKKMLSEEKKFCFLVKYKYL